MGPKYHSLRPWGREDRELSKEALVLQDYCGRAPTRSSEGLFPLPLGYIVVDTPLVEQEIRVAFEELSAARLFDYDFNAEVVLDRTALKTNPLRNPRDKKTGEQKIHDSGPQAGEWMTVSYTHLTLPTIYSV